MEFPKLQVSVRNLKGKGPARRLRTAGSVPAVLYGSHTNALPLAVPPRELIQALTGPLHTNTVLSLELENAKGDEPKEIKAMVRDHQFDPVSRELLHVDFLAVELDKEIEVKVPVTVTGKSIGVALGGTVNIARHHLRITCTPDKIPAEVIADITELDVDDKLTVAELNLPAGLRTRMAANATLIHVVPPRAEKEETTEEGAEGVEGAEGAEAVPAAEEKPAES